MGTPIYIEAAQQPATTIVAVCCVALWLYLQHKGWGYEDVGMSYDIVVRRRLWWRAITAQLCHIDALHVLLNVTSLWSLGFIERHAHMGAAWYMHATSLLLVASPALMMAVHAVLIKVAKREHYMHVTAVGYSCVVFGLMAAATARTAGDGQQHISILGMHGVNALWLPFACLVLTSVLVPRASFIGHACGIAAGFVIGFGAFDWTRTLFWSFSLLSWFVVVAGIGAALAHHGMLPPWLLTCSRRDDEDDVERGQRSMRIVDGTIVRR